METGTLKGKRILLVDDEPRLLQLLHRQLQRRGFECLTAPSGNAALRLAQTNPIDIVISDIRMADGSGIDLVIALRKQDPCKPAIVLVSGYADHSEQELMALGAQLFVTKPFNVDVLLQELSRIFERTTTPAPLTT